MIAPGLQRQLRVLSAWGYLVVQRLCLLLLLFPCFLGGCSRVVAWCVWWFERADCVSPVMSSPTRPTYCATDVVKRRQSKKKGELQIATLPDSQNHHHVPTCATSLESNRGHHSMVRIPYPSSRTDNRPAVAKGCYRSDFPGKTCGCPMVVSQWELNSKNYQGKTGPGPWWSASGAAPSERFSAHPDLQLRPPG